MLSTQIYTSINLNLHHSPEPVPLLCSISLSQFLSSIFKNSTMADSCLLSLPSIFSPKSSSLNFTTISAKPTELNQSRAFSTSFSQSLSLTKKTHFSSTVTFYREKKASTVALEQDPEARLYVGNLSYDVTSKQLTELFEKFGDVEYAEVMRNKDKIGSSRGFGFVRFSTATEAKKAVKEMNGFELNGRNLTVNKASPTGEQVERPPRTFESPLRLFVGLIPWDMDDSALKQMFSEHGEVEDASVIRSKENGLSRGFGFVTMADEAGMNAAIAALDGKVINKRAIKVNAVAYP